MYSPRPVPLRTPAVSAARLKRSKRRPRKSSGTPGPASCTAMVTAPPGVALHGGEQRAGGRVVGRRPVVVGAELAVTVDHRQRRPDLVTEHADEVELELVGRFQLAVAPGQLGRGGVAFALGRLAGG